MSSDLTTQIAERAATAGVELSRDLAHALESYLQLLLRWNRTINLTSLESPAEAIDRLLLEPLIAAGHIDLRAASLIDIGSGGGSPAIPLKLARPDLALTMVESKERKSVFLREAVNRLGLPQTSVEVARYQELAERPNMTASFDVVSVRAVKSSSDDLVRLSSFLRPGGMLMLFGSSPRDLESSWNSQSHPLIAGNGSFVTLATLPG